MAYTPFTIKNLSTTTPADIRSITFVDQSGIVHHSDFSNFGGDFTGDTNNTGNTTVKTRNKTYSTGGTLQKTFDYDTEPVTRTIADFSGTFLRVSSAMPTVTAGWLSDSSDNTYNGLHIVSISGTTATWLTMSGSPSGTPTIGGTVTFSTTTNEINFQSPSTTDGIGPGWTITSNGYTTPGTVISVKDSNTIIVDFLPTNPQQGNPMVFSSSTNFLTLSGTNPTSNINVNWSANGNGYNGTQYITSVVDGNTVIMSAPPNGNPVYGDTIAFSDTLIPIYTLNTSSSIAFSVDYTNSTNVLGNYTSLVTINAIQGGPVVLLVNNAVGINATPVSPTYNPGGGGGGRGGNGGNSLGGTGGTTTGANIGAATPHGADGGMNGGGGATSASGGPAGPGGGECFLPDAKITMADGSVKNFRDLKVGDIVVGAFGELNTVLALYYSKMGNIPMYKINNDHDCTDDEVFVTTDKKFYCIDPEPGTDGVLAGWKESYEMDLGDGTTDIWTSPWSIGQINIELHKATHGIEIQTVNGGRILETFEPYYLPPETELYNCVVSGSHTIMINGYAHTAWVREDDFDYTTWQPIDIKLTVEDYRTPKKSRIGN